MSDQTSSPRRVSTAYILGFSKEPFKEPKMPRSPANFEAGAQPQTERRRPRRKSAIAEIFGTPGGLLEWSASDGRKGVLTGKGRHRLTSDRLEKIPNQLSTVQEALGQGGDAPAPNHTSHRPDKSGNTPNNTDDAGVDKWTIQQDRRLMQLKNENGNWRDIAVECGKTQAQCKARWKLVMPDGWDPKAARKHGNGEDNNPKEEEKARDQHQKQGKNKQEKKKDQNQKNESSKSKKGGGNSDAGFGGLFGGDLFGEGDDANKNDTSGKAKDSSSNTGWGAADNKGADATPSWNNDAGNETTGAAPKWGGASNKTTDATPGWGAADTGTTDAAPAWGAVGTENADTAAGWGATANDTTDATPAWGDAANATTDAAPTWDNSGNGNECSSNTGWQPEKTDAATGWNNSTDNPFLPKPTAKTTDSKKGKGTKKAEGWDTGGDGNWGATSVKSANNNATPAWGADPDLNLPDGGGNDKMSSASWGTKKGSKRGDAKDKIDGPNDPWATFAATQPTGKDSAKAHSTKSSPRKRSHHHRDSKHGSHHHSPKHDTPHDRDSKKEPRRRSHRDETHRNDSGYVKLRPDETFDVDELCIIARILRQDTLDVWERLSYRFRDKTGRNIDPRVFEKKINGYVEGEESDADSWKKG